MARSKKKKGNFGQAVFKWLANPVIGHMEKLGFLRKDYAHCCNGV